MDLKKTVDPVVASATRGKTLAVVQRKEASGCDDLAAVDEMINGADLMGQVPVTGVLPGKFNPGLLMDEALSLRATLLRGRGASLACSSGDPEVGAGV